MPFSRSKIHRIHHALFHFLIGAKRPGLAQQLIDQGGLAVVDVRNDGDVTDLVHERSLQLRGSGSPSLARHGRRGDRLPCNLNEREICPRGMPASTSGRAVCRRRPVICLVPLAPSQIRLLTLILSSNDGGEERETRPVWTPKGRVLSRFLAL